MSWRERYQVASFRGVKFYVKSRRLSGGRRGKTNEFSDRNDPFGQDLGRKFHKRGVVGYILGEDYDRDRDVLRAALDQDGPGEYVDCYGGNWFVICRDWDLFESEDEGGVAQFTISFEESGQDLYPNQVDGGQLDAAAASVINFAIEDFTSNFSVAGLPDYIEASSVEIIDDFADISTGLKQMLPSVSKPVYEGLSFGSVADQFPDLVNRLSSIGVISSPALLGQSIADVVSEIGVPSDPVLARSSYDGYLSLMDFGSDLPVVDITAPSRRAQASNQNALVSLVRKVALCSACQSAARMSFDSYDDANKIRSTLSRGIKAVQFSQSETFDDLSVRAMSVLKSAVVKNITARGGKLARVAKILVPYSKPSVALAYELYGDANRSVEIDRRNNSVDPMMLLTGSSMEVFDR